MLDRIIIDNFATIEHLSFDLGGSLNIITGETGAGKSVLVTAISTVLGDRADTSMVRSGSDKAFIQIAGTKNGEDVVISREIMAGGKSVSKLNGEMVTLGQIRDFCRDWVDIHGQYDNQQILDPDNHILITDSFRSEAGAKLAEYVDLDTLLAQSDVIFLHCPLFPSTEGMINKENIAKMKDGVILINNSRGQLVVEQDLADALNSGKVYAAAVDVVSTEPIRADNPLLKAKNCLITPHISWAAKEARQRIMDITVDNIRSYAGGDPKNVVNR